MLVLAWAVSGFVQDRPRKKVSAEGSAQQPIVRYERVELVRVVDGDTVRLNVEIEPGLWRRDVRCRLARVNMPELSKEPHQAASKERARPLGVAKEAPVEAGPVSAEGSARRAGPGEEAKAALEEFLRGKKLRVEIGRRGRDKYGRWLIELFADGENVSDWIQRGGKSSQPLEAKPPAKAPPGRR
jgi:endonuclease YncB( thermonuclease family)